MADLDHVTKKDLTLNDALRYSANSLSKLGDCTKGLCRDIRLLCEQAEQEQAKDIEFDAAVWVERLEPLFTQILILEPPSEYLIVEGVRFRQNGEAHAAIIRETRINWHSLMTQMRKMAEPRVISASEWPDLRTKAEDK